MKGVEVVETSNFPNREHVKKPAAFDDGYCQRLLAFSMLF